MGLDGNTPRQRRTEPLFPYNDEQLNASSAVIFRKDSDGLQTGGKTQTAGNLGEEELAKNSNRHNGMEAEPTIRTAGNAEPPEQGTYLDGAGRPAEPRWNAREQLA